MSHAWERLHAGTRSCWAPSEQGREHGNWESLVGQARALQPAPSQRPVLTIQLGGGPAGPAVAAASAAPTRDHSTGFTFAMNRAVAFLRNSSLLMEEPSFLSCSAWSMASASLSGPSLEPASR